MFNTVTVNGWSQGSVIGNSSYQGSPLIVFDGVNVPGINLLDLGGANQDEGGPNSIVEGLSIVNFTLDTSSSTDSPLGGAAIIVEPTSPNVQILGNYLGVQPNGSGGVTVGPNEVGVAADAAGLTVGGSAAVDRNIISGNVAAGVAIATLPDSVNVFGFTVPVGGVPATGAVIENNFIGTDNTGESDSAGGAATGNGYGVALGGTIDASVTGNVISGNTADGIIITSNSFNTQLQGYFSSYNGIPIPAIPDQRATGNTITRNSIGTDFSQQSALPNGGNGIDLIGTTDGGNTLTVDNTVIGGPPNTGNVVAGNTGDGILLQGSLVTATTIENNDIGGTPGNQIGNGSSGIAILSGSNGNTVGANSPSTATSSRITAPTASASGPITTTRPRPATSSRGTRSRLTPNSGSTWVVPVSPFPPTRPARVPTISRTPPS